MAPPLNERLKLNLPCKDYNPFPKLYYFIDKEGKRKKGVWYIGFDSKTGKKVWKRFTKAHKMSIISYSDQYIPEGICMKAKCFHYIRYEKVNEKGEIVDEMPACEVIERLLGVLDMNCNHACSKITREYFPNIKVTLTGKDCTKDV